MRSKLFLLLVVAFLSRASFSFWVYLNPHNMGSEPSTGPFLHDFYIEEGQNKTIVFKAGEDMVCAIQGLIDQAKSKGQHLKLKFPEWCFQHASFIKAYLDISALPTEPHRSVKYFEQGNKFFVQIEKEEVKTDPNYNENPSEISQIVYKLSKYSPASVIIWFNYVTYPKEAQPNDDDSCDLDSHSLDTDTM